MKKIYFLVFAIFLCLQSHAQIQFHAGLVDMDFNQFNSDLTANRYPSIDDNVYTFAIIFTESEEGKIFAGRNGFMFNLYEKSGVTPVNGNFNELSLRTIGYQTGFGLNFINTKLITFGPSLDFLLTQNRLRLVQNLPNGLGFSNILSNDTQSEEFRNFRLMMDGSLNLLFKFGKGEGKANYGLGLTGGYRYDPFKPDWNYEKSVKVEIPGSEQSGFFVGLMFTIKGPKFTPPKSKKKLEKS